MHAPPGTAAGEHDPAQPPAGRAGKDDWRRGPTLATVVGAALSVFAGFIGLRSISDNSFFTHLATGRLILRSGIPHADPYSFTATGQPWIVQSWLPSWLYGWADSWAGGAGIRLLSMVLIAAITASAWRLTRPAITLLPRIVITGLVIVVGASFWAPRPLLFGLLFFALLLVAFEARWDPRWAVPIMWLWVQCHGSFPLGLLVIASLTLGVGLDRGDAKPGLRLLGWACAGTLLGAIGPFGFQVLVFPVELLDRMDILSRVIEWKSPNFAVGWARLFLVEVLVAVIALVRRPRYRAAVPMLVFVAAALAGARNVPLASLVMIPVIARGFAGLGGVRGTQRGPGVLVAAAAVVVSMLVLAPPLLRQRSYDLSSYPIDALVWLDQQGLGPATSRLATQDTTGNFIELVPGPPARTFLDDRYDMYPVDVLQDYLTLHAVAPGWQRILEERQIDCVLWDRNEPFARVLVESSEWAVRYQDQRWLVSCRRDLAGAAS